MIFLFPWTGSLQRQLTFVKLKNLTVLVLSDADLNLNWKTICYLMSLGVFSMAMQTNQSNRSIASA